MGFFDRLRGALVARDVPAPLVWRWRLISADRALGLDAGAEAEFAPDGRLTSTVPGPAADTVMLLRYRFERGTPITDQPSAPRQERTGFAVDADALTLDYGGVAARFARVRP